MENDVAAIESLSHNGHNGYDGVAFAKSHMPPARVLEAPAVRQAIIMAGGKGTRLYPYSATFPKPLMPLDDVPILELLLRRLRSAGVTDVVLAVNHLKDLILAYFGDGSKFDLRIRYSSEDQPLGTAGGIAAVLDECDDTFFLMNGDLLTTLNLRRMAQAHLKCQADASVGVFERELKIDFGLIDFDQDNRMVGYREKPVSRYHVSMGVYLLQREAVRPYLKANTRLDVPELLLRMRADGSHVNCFSDDCVWLDIGRPDDFALAQDMFKKDRSLFWES